jgi:PAS domain S-box-containing protein
VETVREPLLALDGTLRVQRANRSFYRTFRVEPAETEGQLLYDLGNRQWDLPALRTLLEDILPQNTSFHDYEMDHAFPSIGRRVMLLNARRLYREGNNTESILLAIEDVTERRKAERAVRDALEYAESIVATVREPLLVLDADMRVWTANRSFYHTFRVSPGETQNRSLYELGNRQWDIPGLRALLEDVLPKNVAFNDYEVVHDFEAIGHKVMLLNARRIRRKDSRQEFILRAIEDITERRRAEEQRRELETRFTSLVKNIKEHAIFTLDPGGRITSWNVEAERILGYSGAEVLGKSFGIIFTPEDVAQGLPGLELRTALAQGRAEDERWHLRKNGERFWALGIVTPTCDAHGNHTGFSKILRDMTERKAAQDLLQHQAEALKEADRRKDEFLAMLAHELRNPLAPIRTGLDRMRLKVPPDSSLHPVMDMVERQLEQMTRLVDDLLDVSRITRGKITLHKERVGLHAVITQAVETARPLIDARQHDLTYTPSPELLLEADPTRLAQALSNVLSNAAKYTEKGGRIWLTVERDKGEAVVRVRDNGIGLEPAMLPTIFDLFTQANQAHKHSPGGLGVGLTVAKRLVEMHGGSVTAHSGGEGQGSEFVFRLPLLKESGGAETAVRGGMESPGRTAGRRRILLVDDLADVAEDMAALVREAFGHEARTAHDGPTALRVAAAFRPELVLLDIGLPGMSGYEVARRLRELPGLGDAVLAALTGWGQEDDRRRAQEAGFNHHLVKPVGLKELQRLLAGLQ